MIDGSRVCVRACVFVTNHILFQQEISNVPEASVFYALLQVSESMIKFITELCVCVL